MLNTQATEESNRQREKTNPPINNDREYIPAMNIFRDNHFIYFEGYFPGVDENSLEISVEGNMLKFFGKNLIVDLDGFELKYSEFKPGNYRRTFQIEEQIDVDHIEALVKNGVVKIKIPIKKPDVKRITVQPN